MYSTVGVAAPLLWIIAAVVAPLLGAESVYVIVPMLTALLLALAIRWGSGAQLTEPRTAGG